MSDPAKLAQELRKISLSHGVVLSHPLLKQMALKALEEQKSVKVAYSKNKEPQVLIEQKHQVPNWQAVLSNTTVLSNTSSPPKLAKGGYVSHDVHTAKVGEKINTESAWVAGKQFGVKGEYHYLKASMPIPLGALSMGVEESFKKDLLAKIFNLALEQQLNLIGKPLFFAHQDSVKMQLLLSCASHAIGMPTDIPSAQHPIA